MGAPARFVVKGPRGEAGAVRARLEQFADVDALTDELLLATPRAAEGARPAAEQIREALDSAEWIAPVVVDDAGHSSYPTGSIGVRFREPRSDRELQEFAHGHGMRLLRRNDYVPEQAVFSVPERGHTFLPDLVERLNGDGVVSSAWPVTTSSYERVDAD